MIASVCHYNYYLATGLDIHVKYYDCFNGFSFQDLIGYCFQSPFFSISSQFFSEALLPSEPLTTRV